MGLKKKSDGESSAKKKGQNEKHKTKAGKKQQKPNTINNNKFIKHNKNASLAYNENKEYESMRK